MVLALLLELAIQTHVALTKNLMMQLDKGERPLCGEGSVNLNFGSPSMWPFLVSVVVSLNENFKKYLALLIMLFTYQSLYFLLLEQHTFVLQFLHHKSIFDYQ